MVRNIAHMSTSDEIKVMEARAAEIGLEMKAVLARAEVHRATWDRWKSGAYEPQMKKWRAVQDAFAALEKTTSSLSALQEAILSAGGVDELARQCGVEPETVSRWVQAKRVPAEFVEKVEFETGVNRTWLRPDLYRAA